MGSKKEYRSASRSRRMIRDAFIELAYEKKNGKITVTDIVNRADINRSTFYAHYADVQGIAEEMEDAIFLQMRPLLDGQEYDIMENPVALFETVGGLLEENKHLYEVLFKAGFSDHFEKRMSEVLMEYFRTTDKIPEWMRLTVFFDVMVTFIIGGIVSVMRRWIQEDLHQELKEVLKELEKMVVSVEDPTTELGWGIRVDIPKAETCHVQGEVVK